MPKQATPSYLSFDRKAYAWKADVDYRAEPERYRVGKGEQGFVNLTKVSSGAHWRFATPAVATLSSNKIYQMFERYLERDDFVGTDMARKFLQMGYARARRYANYKGGKKYDKEDGYKRKERGTGDPEKAKNATTFREFWKKAEADPRYAKRKKAWKERLG